MRYLRAVAPESAAGSAFEPLVAHFEPLVARVRFRAPNICPLHPVVHTAALQVARAYFKLGLDPIASPAEVRRSYRQLSKLLHPDKVGEDEKKLKEFHEVSKAYETITGEALKPYGDLYRQICIDIVKVCEDEEEVANIFQYFPKVKDSKIPGMIETEDEIQSRLGNTNKEANRRDNEVRERKRRELWKIWEEEESAKLKKAEKKAKKEAKKKQKKGKSVKRTIKDMDEL